MQRHIQNHQIHSSNTERPHLVDVSSHFEYEYLKASPLPPAPLAVAGFMVAGLVAWQYSDRLAGVLGFAVWFSFCWYCLLECLLAHWFLDVSFHAVFFVFAALL